METSLSSLFSDTREFSPRLLALAASLLSECNSRLEESFGQGSLTGGLASLSTRDQRRTVCACALFVAKVLAPPQPLSRDPTGPSVHLPLGQIVRAADISYCTFLTGIRDFVHITEPVLARHYGQEAFSRVKTLVKEVVDQFAVIYGFRHHFAKKFEMLFAPGPHAQDCAAAIWLLFLAGRSRRTAGGAGPTPVEDGLLGQLEVLACCINLVLVHAAPEWLRMDLASPGAAEVLRQKAGSGAVHTLFSICELLRLPQTSWERIAKARVPELEAIVHDAVAAIPDLTNCRPVPHPLTGYVDPGCTNYSSLFGTRELPHLVAWLRAQYELQYRRGGELDDRIVMEENTHGHAAGGAGLVGDVRTLTPIAQRVQAPMPGSVFGGGGGLASAGPAAIARNSSLVSPSPLRPAPSGIPGASGPWFSPFASRPHAPPATPITAALSGSAWLRRITADLPDPQAVLPAVLRGLDAEVAASIRDRILRHVATVFPEAQGGAFQATRPDAHIARRGEAARLAFLVLGRMTDGQPGQLAQLASSDRSLRSFVAVICEAVAWAHQIVSLSFPHVVERLDLTPFDIYRFLKPLQRHGSLPPELERHLVKLLLAILEELGWKQGSQLYFFLCKACEHMAPSGNHSGDAIAVDSATRGGAAAAASDAVFPGGRGGDSGETESHNSGGPEPHGQGSHSAANTATTSAGGHGAFAGPGGARVTWLPKGFEADDGDDSPDRPAGVPSDPSTSAAAPERSEASQRSRPRPQENYARQVIREFFGQVLKLSRERISALCDRMELETREQREALKVLSLEVVERVLMKRTSLLYNRHLDQIMLCAVYGVCKVLQMKDQKFKDIVQRYQKQPQASQSVFRQVVTAQRLPEMVVEQRKDIIEFYNHVFMPEMKRYLLECSRRPAAIAAQHVPIPGVTGSRAEVSTTAGSLPPPAPPAPATTGAAATAAAALGPPAAAHAPGSPAPSARPAPPGTVYSTPKRSPRPLPSNVLVSPLRQFQPGGMHGLAQNHPAYVAILGESLHAFTSPSKDLQSINERLQGRGDGGGDERDPKRRKKYPL